MKTWHIIGAGISGLSAAKSIKEKYPNCKVVVYEAANHCGGRCYSFYDKKLQLEIDNATHVILKANQNILSLLGDVSFRKNIYRNKWRLALKSSFNTASKDVPFSALLNVFTKLFPFTISKLGIYFSQNDLSKTLIEPLQKYADEIKLGFVLKGFKQRDGRIISLEFNDGKQIKIGAKDVVISAMDAWNYHKIFNGPEFEFSQITNIVYSVDTPISLPNKMDYMAAEGAGIDWLFLSRDTLTAVVSDAKQPQDAVETWLKIREICGWTIPFIPDFQVLNYPRATIKQDRKNNAKRNAQSAFSNLRIIGDWTMKDWPCSLEAAVISGKIIL